MVKHASSPPCRYDVTTFFKKKETLLFLFHCLSTVSASNMTSLNYPTDDLPIIPWSELVRGKWYHVSDIRDIRLQNPERNVKLLTLKAKDAPPRSVWASSVVTNKINEKTAAKQEHEQDMKLFLKSYGVKRSTQYPGRRYYNCRLMYS